AASQGPRLAAFLAAEARARKLAPLSLPLLVLFALKPPFGPRRAAQTGPGARRACSSTWMAEFAPARSWRAAQGIAQAPPARRGTGVPFSLLTFSWASKRK